MNVIRLEGMKGIVPATDEDIEWYKKLKESEEKKKVLKEITEEEFDNMLNVLPPLAWQTINGVNEFLMSEFWSGSLTSQYARKNGKYYTKLVDAKDKSTWIHNLI